MKICIEKLILQMARKKLSAPELAQKMNVSYSSVSNIMSGRRNPSIKMLGLISESLGIDVTELIEDED